MAAVQLIVAAAAMQRVVAVVAVEEIVAVVAGQTVVELGADDGLDVVELVAFGEAPAAVMRIEIDDDAGDNVIRGNGGDDLMTGGAGADTFAYTPAPMFAGGGYVGGGWGQYGGATFGHDTIMDFTPGQDHIQLDWRDFADYAAVTSHMAQVGSDTVITYDANNSITLHNVQMASLHAGDFMM